VQVSCLAQHASCASAAPQEEAGDLEEGGAGAQGSAWDAEFPLFWELSPLLFPYWASLFALPLQAALLFHEGHGGILLGNTAWALVLAMGGLSFHLNMAS
jgi:hypothetical protein